MIPVVVHIMAAYNTFQLFGLAVSSRYGDEVDPPGVETDRPRLRDISAIDVVGGNRNLHNPPEPQSEDSEDNERSTLQSKSDQRNLKRCQFQCTGEESPGDIPNDLCSRY